MWNFEMNRRKIGTAAAILSAAVIEVCWANDKPASKEKSGDAIVDGVHLYTPKSYVAPTEPAVIEHLEWFKDSVGVPKLGLAVRAQAAFHGRQGMKSASC